MGKATRPAFSMPRLMAAGMNLATNLPGMLVVQALQDGQQLFEDGDECDRVGQALGDGGVLLPDGAGHLLQKMTYRELRETYRLSAQLAIRCISKVSDAYKRDKSIKPTFKPEGAIVYDERLMSFKGLTHVSLLTLRGRVLVPFLIGQYQAARMQAIKGQADLIYRQGTFYLAVTLDVPTPDPQETSDFLGVDLGIVNLATDSDGESFSGQAVEATRKRYHALRQRLQKRGTKSAKRHLKKLSGKQARFQRNTNHVISKRIVQKARSLGKGIAIED